MRHPIADVGEEAKQDMRAGFQLNWRPDRRAGRLRPREQDDLEVLFRVEIGPLGLSAGHHRLIDVVQHDRDLLLGDAIRPLLEIKKVRLGTDIVDRHHVFRGHAAMGATLDEALRAAVSESEVETADAAAALYYLAP